MTSYVALLRGVNIGGRKLRMDELRALATALGLDQPRTFIASGNLLFRSGDSEKQLRPTLESALAEKMGSPVAVMFRTAAEMAAVAKANPFPGAPPNRVATIFLDAPPPGDSADRAINLAGERIAIGNREIYVHFPAGMGQSKLRIPATRNGTARNMNTVKRLAELAKEQP